MKTNIKRILLLLAAAAKADELYAKAVKMAPKSPNKGDTASEIELIEHCRAIEKV